jgi:RecA-family ATPase
MAKFCNQFDLICTELGTAVIYCHHHSKGSQGGKRSMDRASGSGVFARDPDALLDLTQLEVTDALRKQQEDKQTCRIAEEWLRRFYMENAFNELVSQDDRVTPSRMLDIAHGALHPNSYRLMNEDIERAKNTLMNRTAWRIEGTLREFASFKPLNLWFDYPVHISDTDGVLQDAAYEGEIVPYKEATRARKKKAKDDKVSALDSFEIAFSGAEIDGVAAIDDIAQDCGKSADYIKKLFGNGKKGDAEYQKRYEKFLGDDGRAYLKRRD